MPRIPFIQAKNYHKGRISRVRLIVIHDMEYPEKPGGAEWMAGWFASDRAPMASAHYGIDTDSVVQCVRETDTAWHAPGASHDGIGLEHVGYARQTRAEWLDETSTATLNLSAELAADIADRHKIPLIHLTNSELRAGRAGFVGHGQVSEVYKRSTHWDPGPFFPWDTYIARVRQAAGQVKRPEPQIHAAVAGLQRLLDVTVDGLWGPITDDSALRMRTAARAYRGWPRNTPPRHGLNDRKVQAVLGVRVDGIVGRQTRAALKAWVKDAQEVLRVPEDGLWGPGTDGAFLDMREKHFND